ncbi:Integrase core domain-containing protein [Paracoccus aminovorans]|uniref:Integrase core domain-containing protein n=2 Tax=Paracoccus aminovorans TaxID=34004 RepID=A0A1I3BH71_9RHOB|nr:IS3 family transposase [Paracoccus aminovorans]SFH61655.1 Integrase core domain-containing protein [Paracoccus aminovorans]
MRRMRLMPIYQPNISKPGHKTYPYLLGGLRVDRPGQLCCADITCLPMRRGFLYLVAIMHRFTCKALAWRILLEADVCVEALNEAGHRFGAPGIMNADQGAQFTSFVWTERLKRVGTRISARVQEHQDALRKCKARTWSPSDPRQSCLARCAVLRGGHSVLGSMRRARRCDGR